MQSIWQPLHSCCWTEPECTEPRWSRLQPAGGKQPPAQSDRPQRSKTVLKAHQSQKTSGKQMPKHVPKQGAQVPVVLALWLPRAPGHRRGLWRDLHAREQLLVTDWWGELGRGCVKHDPKHWDSGYCGSSSHSRVVLQLPLSFHCCDTAPACENPSLPHDSAAHF